MEIEEYSRMYHTEKDYWWFKGKRFLVKLWIKEKYYRKNLRILDAGCGTGINMKMLSSFGKVYGLDSSAEAIKFCKKRGLRNIRKGTIEKMPYKSNSFDIVLVLDVLTHKSINDSKALKEIYRVLKKGGRTYITDSAMNCLLSRHDKAHHIKERYSKKGLLKKLKRSGFKVEKISYFNSALFLPVYVTRKISNLFGTEPKSDISEINPLLNKLLYNYYGFELSMLKYINYPFGISIFAVGRK